MSTSKRSAHRPRRSEAPINTETEMYPVGQPTVRYHRGLTASVIVDAEKIQAPPGPLAKAPTVPLDLAVTQRRDIRPTRSRGNSIPLPSPVHAPVSWNVTPSGEVTSDHAIMVRAWPNGRTILFGVIGALVAYAALVWWGWLG